MGHLHWGGRLLIGGHNNQLWIGFDVGGDVGEETRPGRNVWRDVVSLNRASDWVTKNKKKKIRRGLKRTQNNASKHNNQPKTHGREGGESRKDGRPAGIAGGVQRDRLGRDQA